MATSSFDRPVKINDEKAASRLLKASKSHKAIRRIDISDELERGSSFLKEHLSH